MNSPQHRDRKRNDLDKGRSPPGPSLRAIPRPGGRTCRPARKRAVFGAVTGQGLRRAKALTGYVTLDEAGLGAPKRWRPPAGRGGSVDAVLREVVAERTLADAHQLRRVLLDAVGRVERPAHRLALGPLEVLPQQERRHARRGGGRAARHEQRQRVRRPAGASTTARSMAFSSSRTLPGQSYACSRASTPSSQALDALARRAARACRRSTRPAPGMSSRRSRSGGRRDRDHVQPVVEILAEPALGDHLPQIAVGRGDHPHVDRLRPSPSRAARTRVPAARAAAWPAAPAHGRRSRRGRSCRRRPARSGPSCWRSAPVNAPLTWPNSSVSSSVSGIAAQLTLMSGRSRSALRGVDGARDQLLAGAGLAGDQHRALGLRDQARGPNHLLHQAAAADDAVVVELLVALGDQVAVLRAQTLMLERARHDHEQLVDVERLLQVVERAELHRGNARSRPSRAPSSSESEAARSPARSR